MVSTWRGVRIHSSRSPKKTPMENGVEEERAASSRWQASTCARHDPLLQEWGSEKEGAGPLIPSVLGDGPRAVTLNGAVVLAAANLEPALLTPVQTHMHARGS